MGKKRKGRGKGASIDGSKATPKMKDPDPNSSEFMYDKMEMFHLNKDKILLDPNADQEDEDGALEENFDEEVLALGGESSDEEEEEEDEEGEEEGDDCEGEDDDIDDDDLLEESDNDDGVHDKAWGKNKKNFYNTDVQDDDIYTSDEEAELAAEEEEKEAMLLQKRLAEKLDADDFYTFEEQEDTKEEAEEEKAVKKVKVAKDLSKLSKRERLEILAEESPELLPLLDEYKEKMNELRERYHPLVLLVRNGLITNEEGAKFIETKHQLLLNYLVNISFYLALKSTAGERTKGHPVINVLVQHQQLFALMKPAEEHLQPEIEHFLDTYKEDIESGALLSSMNSVTEDLPQPKEEMKEEAIRRPKKSKPMEMTMDPLEYYNMVEAHTKAKKAKKQKLDEDALEDQNVEDDVETDEGGKRMITYEMSKNKGLIRNRRKELKNPRVKHKMKFRKAVVKRKGVVREVQREINRYGGETTGITAMLSRSTKIK